MPAATSSPSHVLLTWGSKSAVHISSMALFYSRGGRGSTQAGAGLVADSVPESEYEETVNKAAALGRALDLAEHAFLDGPQ